MIIKLDEDTLDSFLPLVPEELQRYLLEKEAFCLGALRDDTAVGLLVFTVGDGLNAAGELVVMISVHWISVAEEYRRQGVADELMTALYDITGDSPDAMIACDIPLGRGYDNAEAFFTFQGFEFENNDIPVMEITKENFRARLKDEDMKKALSLADESNKPKGLVSLDEISKLRFRKNMKTMLSDEEFMYYTGLSYDRDVYDRGTSFAIMNGDTISVWTLFRKTRSDELHMVMFDASSGADTKEMLALLKYSAVMYYLNEPEGVHVRLTLWKEKSRKLAEYVFPNKDEYTVRRGYLSGSLR